MRLPNAPAPILSPSGAQAAVVQDNVLALIDTATGARRDIALPAHGSGVAFAPDDARLAVAAGNAVALLRVGASALAQVRAALPGALFRWVLGREVLVAVLRSGERESVLCAWRVGDDDSLTPLGPPDGLALGALAVYHMALDEARGRVLLGGVRGRGAYSGDGTPFTGSVGLTPDLPVLWKGEGLPFTPHAYLYPLEDGDLVITQRDRMARLSLNALPDVEVVDERAFDTPLERVALSPNGRLLAWMWAGEGDAMNLHVAHVAGLQPVASGRFTLAGNFPALAVDDAGTATIVAGARPDQMLVVRISAGQGVRTQSVTVPAEADSA